MAEANAWAEYVNQIVDKYNWDTMECLYKKVVDEAAIFGLDDTGWYWSPGFPDINNVTQVTVEGMTDADTQTHNINEFECVLGASEGKRNPTPAGIRIGGLKYMLINHDPATGLAQLTCKGGGAAIMKINTCIVVALFTKEKQCLENDGTPKPKTFQSSGGCAEQVKTMGDYLKDQGF